jgi:hypothetical protein
MPLRRARTLVMTSAVLCGATTASAAEQGVTVARALRDGPSVAALVGYGFQLDTIAAGGVSAYKFGIGSRVGTTFPFHLYLGGTLIAFLGEVVSASGAGGSTYDAHYHVAYGGPEAGYDFNVGRFLLRPYLSFGLLAAVGHTTVRATSAGERDALFYAAPGGLVAYRVQALFFGVDVRFAIPPAQASAKWAPAAMLTFGTQLGASGR